MVLNLADDVAELAASEVARGLMGGAKARRLSTFPMPSWSSAFPGIAYRPVGRLFDRSEATQGLNVALDEQGKRNRTLYRMRMTKFADHDAYISAAPEEFQPLLMQLRSQLAKVLPDTEEVIAYDMPGFGFGKTIIAGYAAFTKQCGLYVSKGAITAYAGDIASAGLKATKTGVTFTPRKPIPDELIKKLALASRRDHGL